MKKIVIGILVLVAVSLVSYRYYAWNRNPVEQSPGGSDKGDNSLNQDENNCSSICQTIRDEKNCETKFNLFKDHVDKCQDQPCESENNYKNLIFEIGSCSELPDYRRRVYEYGLSLNDWTSDPDEGFMAHEVLTESMESLAREKSKVCVDGGGLNEIINKFVKDKDVTVLSQMVAETFEVGYYPGSAAPASFKQTLAAIVKSLPESNLVLDNRENDCFIVSGWNGQLPYKKNVLCFENKSNCYYWKGFHGTDL